MPLTHPPIEHYNRGDVQLIDFIEGSFTDDEYMGYLKGQVLRYVTRFRYKHSPVADLRKAMTYLQWLSDFIEHGRTS